jgi:UDPglucose 6-dehydrogenase
MNTSGNKEVISVIGLGIVGLTTAVGFALKGHKVIGIDIDPEKVKQINEKRCPIYEVGLAEALQKVQISATTDHTAALESDISFLCGGTPPKADGSIDLYYLEVPAKQLGEVLKNKKADHTIVVRSTVIPGTVEKVILPLFKDFKYVGVCMNPEFLREGTAIEDFIKPSRIVIGTNNDRTSTIMQNLYSDFGSPILKTNFKTAEMIKEASNAFLATRISFINEIGNTCRELGIDVYDVAQGMGYDERIGHTYLRAGVGFGGFCLPKDLSALISQAKELGYNPRLLEAVQQTNLDQPGRMIELLKRHFPSLKGKVIGVLGLSFKPGTDDVRKSKALEVIDQLVAEGAHVKAYDPHAMKSFQKVFYNHVEYSKPEHVLDSDAVLIMTEWDEFSKLDYANAVVIDGRRVSKAKEARIYEGICW